MKIISASLIPSLLFLFTLTIHLKLKGQDVTGIAKESLKSSVCITTLDGNKQKLALGSGFFVSKELVITNYHVIQGANSAYININGSNQNISIDGYVAVDKVNDLILLQISIQDISPLNFEDILPEIGEKIYAIGNPKGLNSTFSDGIVSGIRELESKKLVQITAPISPGSSGGPILNKYGKVIGVAVGSLIEGQNLNFCIPSQYVLKLINQKGKLSPINSFQKLIESNKGLNKFSKNGIQIRNIIWDKEYGGGKEELEEYSILNTLSYPVCNIELFFIVYDLTGTPVDYAECTALRYSKQQKSGDTILPGLGKTMSGSEYYCSFVKRLGYKYEIRILDFEILKDEN